MRIPSGVTDQYIYFVAVDATDLSSRETGLTTFTVYRSRDGGAASAMTTPTINEVDATNMPGVYELLVDEDTTIASGNDSEEMVFHITHAGMAPVTRTIELYRPKVTAGETLTVTSGVATANTTQIEGLDATDQINAACDASMVTYGLDHLLSTSVADTDVVDDSIVAKLVSSNPTADFTTFDWQTESLQALRDRGDTAWITGGGGSLTQSIIWDVQVPLQIGLANTATWRIGIRAVNSLDDLPTTGEIAPGTISIDRKQPGDTSWTSVVSDAAMSELAGLIYYDEVFDSGTGYQEGDQLRFTFKNQSITADTNTYEFSGGTGVMYYSYIVSTVTVPSAADVADAVWDESLGAHVTAGSSGERLGRLPNADAAANGGLPTVNASNYIAGIAGTSNTLDDVTAFYPTNFADLSVTATTGLVDVNGKTGFSLASTGLDAITVSEPGAVPAWGSVTVKEALAWVLAFFRNKRTQTATTETLRNDADSADLATSATSDNGTTFTKGEWS